MALRYNDIEFMYPLTNINVAGPEKDPSGSDQLYTTIRLQVRSLINRNLLPGDPTIDGESEATLARVRHMLTAPRRPIYYDLTSLPGQTGETAIINLPDGRDDAGGPWPDPDAFSAAYTTPETIEVTWAVVVKLLDCEQSEQGPGVVNDPLSLRWEDAISFDNTWKATYRRRGTLIISSRSTKTLDQWRRKGIAPMVPLGFARESSEYIVSRDGLRCDFQFTDGQIRYAPPYPAIDMEINQSESGYTLGGKRQGRVSVNMRGVIDANPIDLSRLCIQVAYARLQAANPLVTKDYRVSSRMVLQTRETRDSVECACAFEYMVNPTKFRSGPAQGGGQPDRKWGPGLGGFFGSLFGGPIGGVVGGIAGAIIDAPNNPTEQGTNQNKIPLEMKWVGAGTTPVSPTNIGGYATWANPSSAIAPPVDGVLLAPSVALFAALLRDPCGSQLATTPFVTSELTAIKTDVSLFNNAESGAGAATSLSTAIITAALSAIPAAAYPSTTQVNDEAALFNPDNKPGVYDLWQCNNEYLKEPGSMVIPTCDPDGSNIRVNYSSKMMTLARRWIAHRTGSPPGIPPEDPEDDNLVLVYSHSAPREMEVGADGVSIIYRAEGYYIYQVLDLSKLVPVAEIPPFIAPGPLTNLARWMDNVEQIKGNLSQTNRDAAGGGSTGTGQVAASGSGTTSVLGSGQLISGVPF